MGARRLGVVCVCVASGPHLLRGLPGGMDGSEEELLPGVQVMMTWEPAVRAARLYVAECQDDRPLLIS